MTQRVGSGNGPDDDEDDEEEEDDDLFFFPRKDFPPSVEVSPAIDNINPSTPSTTPTPSSSSPPPAVSVNVMVTSFGAYLQAFSFIHSFIHS